MPVLYKQKIGMNNIIFMSTSLLFMHVYPKNRQDVKKGTTTTQQATCQFTVTKNQNVLCTGQTHKFLKWPEKNCKSQQN